VQRRAIGLLKWGARLEVGSIVGCPSRWLRRFDSAVVGGERRAGEVGSLLKSDWFSMVGL
jgi:hypothetical protein